MKSDHSSAQIIEDMPMRQEQIVKDYSALLCDDAPNAEVKIKNISEYLHDDPEEKTTGNMEDWELEGTRRTMIGAHLATLDVQDRQEDFWLGQTAAGLETGIEELVAQLEQVTREQVAQAAQKLELDTIYFLKGTEG